MGGREFLFETRHHRPAVNRPLFNTSDTSSFGSGRDVHAADANLSARRLAMTRNRRRRMLTIGHAIATYLQRGLIRVLPGALDAAYIVLPHR